MQSLLATWQWRYQHRILAASGITSYKKTANSYIAIRFLYELYKSFLSLHCNPIRMKKYLVISTATDLVRVAPEKIVYISSDGNYSTLVLANDETRVLTLQLGQVERLIESQLGKEGNSFIRIGRSHIINRSYIYYINVSRQKLVLSDNDRFSHMLNPSKEALGQLKELLERDLR